MRSSVYTPFRLSHPAAAHRCGFAAAGPAGRRYRSIGNEIVPKIIINSMLNLFLSAIGILEISNHNTYLVLFDKIASVYFI